MGLHLKGNGNTAQYNRGELEFLVMSGYDLNEINRYDYVLCDEVIEHVEQPEKLIERIYASMGGMP